MRLSKSFLGDYLDIKDLSFTDIAKKMVLAGNEYESLTKLSNATNLVIGQVTNCIKHPESTKLSVCTVDLGNESKQIICGASNVAIGQKVVVAKVGAILDGGIEIKAAKLAGLDSEGMICSLAELGIEAKYLTDDDKNGIHILATDAPVGQDAIKYLGFDDEIIDFELTSNRADLLSVIGMAYEVGAIYNKKVTLPDNKVEEIDDNITYLNTLEVLTANCSLYLSKLVRNVVIKESPIFIKNRLIASGIRPINNVVDISNYVMMEYGQPLHFFDADLLGTKVIVRMAEEKESLTTLDGITRILKTSDIVIANDQEVVALAGVMGGLATEVTKDTKNIFIEAAIFDSNSVRTTANKNNLRSEASNRFEKGVDPKRTLLALIRAAYLLNKYASGEVLTGVLTFDEADQELKRINLSLTKINNVLGMKLKSEEVINIFTRLGFAVIGDEDFEVVVPTRRLDINIQEDLIEEVGRINGYDNIVGQMPKTMIKSGNYSRRANLVKELRSLLNSLGLNQVITYSLVSKEEINKFVPLKHEEIVLLNPMSEDKKIMRQSLLTGLMTVWEYNFARNIKDINIFEVGSVYYLNQTYHEDMTISGLLYGNYLSNDWQGKVIKNDFYVTKGIIENILKYLGLANRYTFSGEHLPSDFHPVRSASIIIDNQIIGHFGQVHPLVNKKEIYLFELNLDKLLAVKVREIKFKEVCKFPCVNKDLAFVVDHNVTSAEIMNVIKKVGGRLLYNLDVFDVYVGDNVAANEKSIAYSLTFQDQTKTLNDEEVTEIVNKIIKEVEITIPAKLRTK